MYQPGGTGCGCFGIVFVAIVLPVIVFLALAVLGPTVGNVFSNISGGF